MIHTPLVQPVDGNLYMLMADFTYPFGMVPAGFTFDGASIPPWGWHLTYTPWHPKVLGPACAHDWEYLIHRIARSEVDQMFHDMLIENEANPFKAHMMLSAVQSAGRYFWTQNEADIRRLHYMREMCRGRIQFESYGLKEIV